MEVNDLQIARFVHSQTICVLSQYNSHLCEVHLFIILCLLNPAMKV